MDGKEVFISTNCAQTRYISQKQLGMKYNITKFLIILLVSIGCQSQKKRPTITPQLPNPLPTLGDYKKEVNAEGIVISEGYYLDGIANGPMKWYHDKGHLAAEGTMHNGKRTGVWKVYAIDDGVHLADVLFDNDREIGVVNAYYSNGQYKYTHKYEAGELFQKTCYDSLGTVIDCSLLLKHKQQ